LAGSKLKKQRKVEKLVVKELVLQHNTSIFTDAYTRQQQRSHHSEENKTIHDLQQHSFHVEDYLLL